MAHPAGMQLAFRINDLQSLTPASGPIVSQCFFGASPNHLETPIKEKAAATGIANGFGIHTQTIYSVSDSRLQEVRG